MDTTAGADMREAWRRVALGAALFAAAACGGSSKGGSSPPEPVGTANVPPGATPAPVPTPAPPAPTPQPAATPTPAPAPGPSAACTPVSCATAGKNCGAIDDGCGGKLFCGTCVAGQVCGAGGAANVCGAPVASCTPTTCEAQHATCGRIPNGCGGTLDCGGCTGAQTCGGGGTPNACGAPPVKGGDTRWVQFVSGADAESVQRVRSDAAGNVYAAGLVQGDRPALFLRKYGSDGSLAWEKRGSAPARSGIWIGGFAVSAAGESYVAFQTWCPPATAQCGVDLMGAGIIGAGIVKVGADGGQGFQQGFQAPSGFAVGPNGEFPVLVIDDATHRSHFDLVARNGVDRKWSSTLPFPRAFAFAPDGSVFVAWNDPDDGWAEKLSKLDAAGKTQWTRTTQGYAQWLATSGRGTLVAAESSQLAVYESADGAQRFRVTVPLWANDLAVRPGIHDVVEAVVVGQDQAGCGQMEARAYDLAGAFRWVRLVGPTVGCGGSPAASAVTVLDSGDVVVGGTQTTETDFGQGARAPEGASDGFLLGLAP